MAATIRGGKGQGGAQVLCSTEHVPLTSENVPLNSELVPMGSKHVNHDNVPLINENLLFNI